MQQNSQQERELVGKFGKLLVETVCFDQDLQAVKTEWSNESRKQNIRLECPLNPALMSNGVAGITQGGGCGIAVEWKVSAFMND